MLGKQLLCELPCYRKSYPVAYPAGETSYHASYCAGGKVTLWLTQLWEKVTMRVTALEEKCYCAGKKVTMGVTMLEEKLPRGLPSLRKKLQCKLWRKRYPVSYHVGEQNHPAS